MKGNGWTITSTNIGGKAEETAHEAHTIPFALFDDDDNEYFTGVMSQKLYDAGEHIFDPLDYAMAMYGCSYMKVKNPKTGEWEHV